MKLTKTQRELLTAMQELEPGERVTRHWQSPRYILRTKIDAIAVRIATVKALIDAGLACERECPDNRQYTYVTLTEAGRVYGVTQEPIDHSADDGSQNRQPDDITPDACEPDYDAATVAPAPTDSDYDWRADDNEYPPSMVVYPSPMTLHDAWSLKMDAMRRYGRYAPITLAFWAAFDVLFAFRLAV